MIEFEEYKGKLNGLKPTLDSLREALHLEAAEKEIEELEGQSARDGFWNDVENSQRVQKRLKQLKAKVENYEKLCSGWDDLMTLCEMAIEEDDDSMLPELQSEYAEFEKKLVAYHEVGHAMVAYKQKNAEPVQKITIVPHTEGSLGYTLLMPEEDKTNLRTRDELMAKIAVSMGGRAAEEVVMNTMTNGASQDIQEATNIARNMVAMYGMSDEIGMVALGSVRNQYLDGGYGLDCAQDTAAIMDREVKRILDECYKDAVQVIRDNREDMDKVVAYLLEKETITGGEMVAILEGRDPATVEDAYASKRRSDSDFRPSVPSTIEAPARHISMTSEKIEMPPLDGEAPDESAASDAENGKNAESPAEETPAQDAPAGDGAETPDHE